MTYKNIFASNDSSENVINSFSTAPILKYCIIEGLTSLADQTSEVSPPMGLANCSFQLQQHVFKVIGNLTNKGGDCVQLQVNIYKFSCWAHNPLPCSDTYCEIKNILESVLGHPLQVNNSQMAKAQQSFLITMVWLCTCARDKINMEVVIMFNER